MEVEFLKQFSKDLDSIKLKSVKQSLTNLIEMMENVDTISEIPNIKKLKGHKTAYRVRIGDYRLGFFFESSTIIIARFLHRKDIYKLFP